MVKFSNTTPLPSRIFFLEGYEYFLTPLFPLNFLMMGVFFYKYLQTKQKSGFFQQPFM